MKSWNEADTAHVCDAVSQSGMIPETLRMDTHSLVYQVVLLSDTTLTFSHSQLA